MGMNPFTEKTIRIIKSIPEGKIMTYGQIARAAGSPRGARQVVRILHSMSRVYDLPWHRVINAKGEIAIKDEESHFTQISLLKSEGIEMDENNRINIEQYRYYVEE
jgi:methylated-DNA-protein-cysteine methyltransferase-like protein